MWVCRLFQPGYGLGDTAHGLTEVVVGCRVAEPYISRGAECRTVYCGHMGLFEQIHCQVARCGDYAVAETLAEHSAYL